MHTTQQSSHLQGTILAIDPERGQLVVQSLIVNKGLQLAGDVEIVTAAGSPGTLDDLQVGERVQVEYEPTGASDIAHCVRLVSAGESA